MAVKLVARMSLVDKFSGPMRNVERSIDRNQRSLDKMRTKAKQAGESIDKLNKSGSTMSRTMGGFDTMTGGALKGIGRLASALNPLNVGFLGIATAASAAYGAVKLFNATVGEAMKMQQSEIVIGAMFDDKKLSADYMKLLDRLSIKSPLMDSQQMYGNSKSFITASKDIGQLEQMWGLAERLMASDPQQGLEGAIFALRELFSGDAISIVDRFELPRKVMNDIKKLPLDEQLTKLDEYFNKIGLTTGLIDAMGGSALGMWSQVKERFQLVLRDMGEPSLKAVSTFLGGLIDRLEGEDMKKFGEWGGRVIENMVTGLSNNAIKLYDWLVALSNSEEFKSKSTLFGKIDFIVGDIGARLNAWYDNGGEKDVMKFGSRVTETLMGILNNSKGFAEVGIKLGNSLVDGVVQGIKSAAESSIFGKAVLAAFNGSQAGLIYKGSQLFKNEIIPGFQNRNTGHQSSGGLGLRGLSKSHSAGLERVPYDGYAANLHEYREGNNGGINITVQNLSVREESDIEKVAMALARLIEGKGGPVPA